MKEEHEEDLISWLNEHPPLEWKCVSTDEEGAWQEIEYMLDERTRRDGYSPQDCFEGCAKALGKGTLVPGLKAHGDTKLQMADLRKNLAFRLIKKARRHGDEFEAVLAIAGFIRGISRSCVRKGDTSWLPDVFRQILRTARTLGDDEQKTALLSASILQVSYSIITGLFFVADGDWRAYYMDCLDFIGTFRTKTWRFYAYMNFAKAIGDDCVNEDLQGADWLKEFLLAVIDRILTELSTCTRDVSRDLLRTVHEQLASRLGFLTERIEKEYPKCTSRLAKRQHAYDSLLKHVALVQEDDYTEKDPLNEVVMFETSPQTALLCTMAKDFIQSIANGSCRVFQLRS